MKTADCAECGAEIEFDGGDWWHTRIDDGSHDARPVVVESAPLLVRADWFGRPNWHCPSCSCNYSNGAHVPGSTDCQEARDERLISINADRW